MYYVSVKYKESCGIKRKERKETKDGPCAGDLNFKFAEL